MQSTEYRMELYDIFSDPGGDVDEAVQRSLAAGTEFLDIPIGFFTRIADGTQRIVHSVGDHPLIQSGETCPLDEAYCRRTVEMEDPLAVQEVASASVIPESAVERFDLGTYVGAKVSVNGETYGTVCFASEDSRDEPFTEAEVHFVELFAQLAGQAVERREYERELEAREERLDERAEIYRAVLDASFDLVFRVDDEGRFTFVSSPVVDLLGYESDEYEGEPFTLMLPDEETVETATELYRRVMAGETVESEYLPLQHARGDRVFVDVRVTPIYDSTVPAHERGPGDVVGAQGMASDATDRRRREQLIQVLNRVLRHNLRNDMTVVKGFAEMLRDRLAGEEAGFAARIVETSDRLVDLSETARNLEETLQSPPEIAETDVVPVVERAAGDVSDQYPDADVEVRTPETAVARSAPRLETAVWELVENAAKHAGDQPAVTVDVSRVDDRVVIRVADDGPGLPAQERAVLASGDETPLVHGSGLGLWLVHWIVESLNGTLVVRETDTGTCVEVRLQTPDDTS